MRAPNSVTISKPPRRVFHLLFRRDFFIPAKAALTSLATGSTLLACYLMSNQVIGNTPEGERWRTRDTSAFITILVNQVVSLTFI
jgi:hypothetical protein